MITEGQKKRLAYNDLMLKNQLSNKQKLAIEYKERQDILKCRTRAIKVYKDENKIKLYDFYISGDRKNYDISEITEEMIEKNVEAGFNIN